ncbi:F0F1 ATP synthase subunit delta [Bacillus sp. ISL-40]|uniref:F0F1 ATP synthase subunit delta n=1 Tax=unclassified Bacillus (in: firmicutes) TaxID=185979 RepID=UPI001BEA9275|nr:MULTISPECIES: F0F1 ATP synthase subunit delta [unclassified Bacillus (in: firmicutes)]MBT2699018.1 F0F1 ATP synthase subunit delta [Bacillus sp. ISL-40]MBT2723690.1 F0F1 ATP synthase subunit delta [Bacillus sp. ISL-46]MBT2726638.1 F0F1 ATP synthase subunit delta [Bacillus sp. ISL-75]MBT2739479.1 F0F1 ATP synthase subunit delta [Bacillus sp. ISL-77]
MSNSMVAKRYALALFQIAKETQALGVIEEELRVVKEVVQYNPELKNILNSSKLSIEEKKEIIKSSFATVNVNVLNTMLILIDRHREDQIVDVANEFLELANDEMGIAEAQVYSTRELTDAEREAISSVFAAKVGKKSLKIENIVDSNLLGGIRLRIGNRIYDGSLRGKLDRLERKLLS